MTPNSPGSDDDMVEVPEQSGVDVGETEEQSGVEVWEIE